MTNKSENKEYDAAHKKVWQAFEVVFGIPFLAAITLEFVIPLSFSLGFLSPALGPGGIFFIIAGVSLIFLARREFKKQNQPTNPGLPTSKLITTGVFSVSRNPLYLGGVCIFVGIALIFHIGWVFILLMPSFVACHYILITPEERYLAKKFGEEYRKYASAVCRWFGRKIKRPSMSQ